jgi:hypothetical protein
MKKSKSSKPVLSTKRKNSVDYTRAGGTTVRQISRPFSAAIGAGGIRSYGKIGLI